MPVLGASGAIAGVMGAYLVFRPRGRILTVLLWVVLYVPAWVLLGLFFVTQFLTPNEDSVAWIAHAAGMAAGFLAALVLARFFPDPWKPVTQQPETGALERAWRNWRARTVCGQGEIVQDDLADVGVGLHAAVGLGRLVEREAGVDDGAERARTRTTAAPRGRTAG